MKKFFLNYCFVSLFAILCVAVVLFQAEEGFAHHEKISLDPWRVESTAYSGASLAISKDGGTFSIQREERKEYFFSVKSRSSNPLVTKSKRNLPINGLQSNNNLSDSQKNLGDASIKGNKDLCNISFDITGQKNLCIRNNNLTLISPQLKKTIILKDLPSVTAAALTSDGNNVVLLLVNGVVVWVNLKELTPFMYFYSEDKGEKWVYWTPAGYFDASFKGAEKVGLSISYGQNHRTLFFPFETLSKTLHEPQLIDHVFEASSEIEGLDNFIGFRAMNGLSSFGQLGLQIYANKHNLPPLVKILSIKPASVKGKIKISYYVKTKSPVLNINSDCYNKPKKEWPKCKSIWRPKSDSVYIRVLIDGVLRLGFSEESNSGLQEITLETPKKESVIALEAENFNGTTDDFQLFKNTKPIFGKSKFLKSERSIIKSATYVENRLSSYKDSLGIDLSNLSKNPLQKLFFPIIRSPIISHDDEVNNQGINLEFKHSIEMSKREGKTKNLLIISISGLFYQDDRGEMILVLTKLDKNTGSNIEVPLNSFFYSLNQFKGNILLFLNLNYLESLDRPIAFHLLAKDLIHKNKNIVPFIWVTPVSSHTDMASEVSIPSMKLISNKNDYLSWKSMAKQYKKEFINRTIGEKAKPGHDHYFFAGTPYVSNFSFLVGN